MHLGDGAEIDGGMMRALVDVSVKAPKFARIGSRASSSRQKAAQQLGDRIALVLDVNEEKADKLLLTFDPVAAMAEADAAGIKTLLQTVQTDSPAVEELLRRIAGEQLWTLIHPQAEPPAQIDKAGELQRKWGPKPASFGKLAGIAAGALERPRAPPAEAKSFSRSSQPRQ